MSFKGKRFQGTTSPFTLARRKVISRKDLYENVTLILPLTLSLSFFLSLLLLLLPAVISEIMVRNLIKVDFNMGFDPIND